LFVKHFHIPLIRVLLQGDAQYAIYQIQL